MKARGGNENNGEGGVGPTGKSSELLRNVVVVAHTDNSEPRRLGPSESGGAGVLTGLSES